MAHVLGETEVPYLGVGAPEGHSAIAWSKLTERTHVAKLRPNSGAPDSLFPEIHGSVGVVLVVVRNPRRPSFTEHATIHPRISPARFARFGKYRPIRTSGRYQGVCDSSALSASRRKRVLPVRRRRCTFLRHLPTDRPEVEDEVEEDPDQCGKPKTL